MQTQTHPLPEPGPPEFWEDHRWSIEHATEISEKYSNQWVAVCDKKVIAAGKDGAEVEKIATEKVGGREFVIFFAEKGIHIYEG